jgi:hypothetical protein
MKAIISILYKCNHLCKLGPKEKIRVKQMISELKSIARTGKINVKLLDDVGDGLAVDDPTRSSFNNI